MKFASVNGIACLLCLFSAQVESTFLMNSSSKPVEVRVKSEPVEFTMEQLQSGGSDQGALRLVVDDQDNCQVI